MELTEQEKNRIRYNLKDENKLFTVIDDIIKEHIENYKVRHQMAEHFYLSIKQKKNSDFWNEDEIKLYNDVFLSLPEKIKKGRHTKEFVKIAENKTKLSPKKLEEYYRRFVKRYELQDIDKGLFEIAEQFTPA